MRKILHSVYLKIAVTLLLLYYLSRQIDFNLLQISLQSVNYFYLPLLVFVIICFWIVNVMSLYFLLLPIGEMRFATFFKYQLKSIVLGSVTPMELGEATIFIFFKKNDFPLQQALSAFLLNKVIHVILMFLTGFIFLYYIQYANTTYLLLTVVLMVATAIAVVQSPLRILIREIIVKKYFDRYYNFFELVSDYVRKHAAYLLLNIAVNLVKVIVAGVIIWLNFRLFNININVFLLASIYNMTRILSLIPVSISGLGIQEGGVALALSKFGFNYSIIVTAMFFLRLLAISMALVFLLYTFLKRTILDNDSKTAR